MTPPSVCRRALPLLLSFPLFRYDDRLRTATSSRSSRIKGTPQMVPDHHVQQQLSVVSTPITYLQPQFDINSSCPLLCPLRSYISSSTMSSSMSTPRSGQDGGGGGGGPIAFIEMFDLGGRFEHLKGKRRRSEGRRSMEDSDGGGGGAGERLIEGGGGSGVRRKHEAARRRRQQSVNNFLERPRGWKALSYHLSL
ncbi:hypothetical protein JTE90_021172 [Oedothorax gibbosus]|uniref:Uncharacterized protein n=1 Tax=Oedothorax gibbosus TaxID=931172 RepID=A0AAV6V612_9ARAC|nr:hypothetical protein JTE90_021172 [Oedothorax gibbosus]